MQRTVTLRSTQTGRGIGRQAHGGAKKVDAHRPHLLGGRGGDGLLKVGDDVVDVLQAD